MIESETLRARLSREPKMPISEAARILLEVAVALAPLHRRGVVHGDIRPENVQLRGDRGARLLPATTPSPPMPYSAPETTECLVENDPRSDIYSVGALAYEMLVGAPPFAGRSAGADSGLLEPHDVTDGRPGLLPQFASLVMRCLESEPAARWQTIDELVTQLESAGSAEGSVVTLLRADAAGIERTE